MALARGRLLSEYFFTLSGEKFYFRAVDDAHAVRHCRKIYKDRLYLSYSSGKLAEFDKGSLELHGVNGLVFESNARDFRNVDVVSGLYGYEKILRSLG